MAAGVFDTCTWLEQTRAVHHFHSTAKYNSGGRAGLSLVTCVFGPALFYPHTFFTSKLEICIGCLLWNKSNAAHTGLTSLNVTVVQIINQTVVLSPTQSESGEITATAMASLSLAHCWFNKRVLQHNMVPTLSLPLLLQFESADKDKPCPTFCRKPDMNGANF